MNLYRNASYGMNNKNYPTYVYSNDGERFFWAPFVVGGTYKLVHYFNIKLILSSNLG